MKFKLNFYYAVNYNPDWIQVNLFIDFLINFTEWNLILIIIKYSVFVIFDTPFREKLRL